MGLKELENYPDINFIEGMTLGDMKDRMVRDFQEKYAETTGRELRLAEADPVRLVLYATALQIYQGMQYIDSAAKQSFLKYSYGDFLENLGALKGIKRNPAEPARTVVRFTLSGPSAGVTEIRAGTRVTPGGNVFFCTEGDGMVRPGETSADIPAVCTEAGAAGNGYEAGSIRTLVDKIPYVAEVSNISGTSGGAEKESDESLAERIYLAPSRYSVAGPDDAYRYWAMTYSPSVTDVMVTSPSPGDVDIRFTVNDGEIPTPETVAGMEKFLADGERRPLTDRVTVGAPETVPYRVDVEYWINESDRGKTEAVRKNVEEAVRGFAYWQRKQIGRDINPSYLNYMVVKAGAKRAVVREPVFTVVGDTGLAVMEGQRVEYGGVERD